LFIIFDMDGTLVDERSRELIPGVRETLALLKAQGHFISVCSNNVLAKDVLEKHYVLHMFDFVIGHSSSSFKTLELIECWAIYRYMYRVKLTRWKIHLNRMVFVDNDQENLSAVKNAFECVRVCASVAALENTVAMEPKPRGVTINEINTKLFAEYRVPLFVSAVPANKYVNVFKGNFPLLLAI